MKKRMIILAFSLLILSFGCGNETDSASTPDEQVEMSADEMDDGLVKVEIEKVDTTLISNEQPEKEKKNRNAINVAVVGSPATDILAKADESIADTNNCIEAVKCDNYTEPFEKVISGEVQACLSSNQVFLDSYNKINESDLVIAERIYIDPLAIFPGKINDLNNISGGIKVAVAGGDVNVARALYLLEQKGLLEVKEEASYQASMEDVTSNPHNISIEEVDVTGGWPDTQKYGLIICDYNRAVLLGIDPDSALGEENRNSKIFDLFTVNLVVKQDMLEDTKTAIILKAVNSDIVEDFIYESFYNSVLDYK